MKQKDLLFLVISSFTLIVFWIIFNIYHSSVTSTISDSLIVQIAPINPAFDLKTLNSLKSRTQISPIYSSSATSSAIIIVPTPTVKVSTQSALIQNNSTQSAATSGGALR